MNSKGWKVGFFAIAAVVALSACGKNNKSKNAGSPYAGIWINQENMREYSSSLGELNGGDYRGYCKRVYATPHRYGDQASEFQMRALLVQANGEVYKYRVGATTTTRGFRERNLLGTVNGKGLFTSGTVGPDGRLSSWDGPMANSYDLPSQSTMIVRGDTMTVMGGSVFIEYKRYTPQIAEEYSMHTSRCLVKYREWHVRQYGEGSVVGGGYGPGEFQGGEMPPPQRYDRKDNGAPVYAGPDVGYGEQPPMQQELPPQPNYRGPIRR